jgi:hypothetical protein
MAGMNPGQHEAMKEDCCKDKAAKGDGHGAEHGGHSAE